MTFISTKLRTASAFLAIAWIAASCTADNLPGEVAATVAVPTPTPSPILTDGNTSAPSQPVSGSSGEPLPAIANYEVFTAKPPYAININGQTKHIQLGIYGSKIDVERSFDLAGPLINPATGRINALSWQVVYPFAGGLRHVNLNDTSNPQPTRAGVPGRIEYSGGKLKLAYLAGDPPDGGDPPKCRVQVNSWYVPTRQEVAWDLSFQLGGTTAAESWPLLPRGQSPTALWQLKADPGYSTLAMIADTDDAAAGTVKLSFHSRTASTPTSDRIVTVGGLKPGAPIEVFMTANLDERRSINGGSGYWRIWVNGTQISAYDGQTLRSDFFKEAHRWSFGAYLYANDRPTDFSRITYWQRARMLVPK